MYTYRCKNPPTIEEYSHFLRGKLMDLRCPPNTLQIFFECFGNAQVAGLPEVYGQLQEMSV
jgi:hypothetical protein